MPDTNPQDTLDTNASEIRHQRFQAAWRAWRAGAPAPRWQEHLPADEEPCHPDLIFRLLQLDIECRAKAGLPALLAERYFEDPRLQREDARLDDARQVELIHQEYLQRLKNGDRPRRAEYEAAFPRHVEALREMKPRSRCPRCHKIIVLEETFQTLLCPDCGCESSLLAAAPPFVAGTTPSGAAPPKLDLRGYELSETLGKGGMGEVYRCCDPALGRDLAIKVMKASLGGHAEVERRFLREARITGSLQHPGIVAVHNLGRLADGRLHYTMRLVRGQTFAAILKEEAGKPARLPYLLTIFEKICQAVAYAHSKRVLHRDLKPSNVMVGRFGEVQVMDWGLAKLLTADDASAESEKMTDAAGTRIPTEADTPIDLSRTGSGFGTPAYMPPEQALGEWDTVDERADVFALGSILCEILTGQPAYSGTDGNEVYRRVKRGDVAEALQRLEQCGADAALTTLCRECLSPNREARPRYAGVVAERVAAYQAAVQELLRQAEVERAEAQVKAREERKRRRLVLKLSGVILLLLVTGTVTSILFALDARRQTSVAKRNAEDAAREKQKADDNAKRALEKEQIATQAQEKTETVLVAGLLRPMSEESTRSFGGFAGLGGIGGLGGLGGLADVGGLGALGGFYGVGGMAGLGGFGGMGGIIGFGGQQLGQFGNLGFGGGFLGFSRSTWRPLSIMEVEALTSLRSLPSDHVRVRFLEEGLRTAETARRLKHRAEWVIQALVGLDAGRRRQVEEVLMRHLRQPKEPDEVKELCVILGTALEVQDPSFEELVANIIIAAMVRHINQNDLNALPETLQTLQKWSERLNTHRAGQVADALLADISQTTNPNALSYLSQALQAVSGRLDAAHAGKIADALLADMSRNIKTTNSIALFYLPQVLQAVSGHLDAAHAAKVADALLAAMSKTTDPNALSPLILGLQAVSWRLDAAHAGKVADALLATMSKKNDSTTLLFLSQALQAVSGRLDAAHAGKIADALLADMSRNIKTTNSIALSYLPRTLLAVSGHLDAAHAVKVADALLAAMSQTTNPNVLSSLAWGLQAVSGRLEAVAAATRAAKAADVLLAALSRDIKTNDGTFSFSSLFLPQALQAVSGHLDAAHAGKIADALLTDIIQTTNSSALSSLSQALRAVSGRLDAAHAGKVADALLAAMSKKNDSTTLLSLSQALPAVSGRLDAAHAVKVADALLAAMSQTTNPNVLSSLAWGLQAVSGRLEELCNAIQESGSLVKIGSYPGSLACHCQGMRCKARLEAVAAATRAAKAADVLLAAMSRTTDLNALPSLAQGLQAVSGHLDAAHAGKVADALLATMSKKNDSTTLLSLSQALQAVSGRLDAAHAGKVADALLPAMSQTTDSSTLFSFFQALQTVSEPRTTRDLLALLSHPLAAGPAQRALLNVLGHRTRRQFRNTWHFLDWARSNGVDLVPLSQPAGDAH